MCYLAMAQSLALIFACYSAKRQQWLVQDGAKFWFSFVCYLALALKDNSGWSKMGQSFLLTIVTFCQFGSRPRKRRVLLAQDSANYLQQRKKTIVDPFGACLHGAWRRIARPTCKKTIVFSDRPHHPVRKSLFLFFFNGKSTNLR